MVLHNLKLTKIIIGKIILIKIAMLLIPMEQLMVVKNVSFQKNTLILKIEFVQL